MPFTLPELPYAYDALEPHIDAKTMEIHHTKHHQGYTDKLNATLEKYPELAEQGIEELLKNIETLAVDEADRVSIRNNGGGYANHALFWDIMGTEKQVDDDLMTKITETFGSIDDFKKLFSDTAAKRFGSGWAWLVMNADGQLEVYSTANQDSPLMQGHKPIIGLDVWEHAYYLNYQNKRPDYIENWWSVLRVL
ncbi:MAG: superoxide dismutase [Patescibacteria group bacterium]